MFSFRHTWARISLDAIAANVGVFRSRLQGDCRLMAVVKADGYGHGAVPVAKAALDAGATHLAVAFLDEALQLRLAGINTPILVLGYTPPEAVRAAVHHDITLTVFSLDTVLALEEQTALLRKQARVHLKIDTGMSRLGLTEHEDIVAMAQRLQEQPLLFLEGVFTHFADADNEDEAYTRLQFERFTAALAALDRQSLLPPLRHCCNTAATLRYPDMHLDMVRVGIGLYGLAPYPAARSRIQLEPAMQFGTKVASLKRIPKGQPVSYGCTYVPDSERLIAAIPAGYADGLSRLASNRGFALANGLRVPIVGRVCMDQTMLDVTRVPEIAVGTEITLFGSDDDGNRIHADEWAGWMGTISYEVVCLIGKRVPRIYLRHGQITESVNLTVSEQHMQDVRR